MVYTSFSSKTESEAETTNHLMSAALFTTLAVTIWTTVLIAYRIHSTSNFILNRKKPRFYNIIEIVMQSSLIYSLALVPTALIVVVPPQQSNLVTLTIASYYLGTILTGVAVR